MACAFRSLLISMALLTAAAGTASAKGKPPAPHAPAHRPAMPKPPHLPAVHPFHLAPRHIPLPRVTHHPRPMVYHGPIRPVRLSTTRIVRQPVRHTAIRTVHRYPVRRVPFRFARRLNYYGMYGYTYSSYPRRYLWRTHYSRGYGALQRRRPRIIGGILESVQGVPGNGILVVRAFRPRSSRFR
jgi:hypothetical protein